MKKILFVLLLFFNLAASAQRVGTDYAVFFYVTDFQPGWATLPETAKEAIELKTELETNFGFTCEAVPNPSKAQILAKIKTYNDRLGPNDQVLFFFSMHGHYEESVERGFLIAADGALKDDYGDTWLSYDDLSGYLGRCKAKHVLLAIDACHSGSFGIRNKARPDVPNYSQTDDCAQRVAKMFQFIGRQYCTSGNKEAKTPAKSLFASRFLEALRKGGEEGLVRFDDLEYYLGKVENPRPESGTFKGHQPGGDFVFIKRGGCTVVAVSKSLPIDDNTAEEQVWKIAQKRHDAQLYLDEYPSGKYKEQAFSALRSLGSEGITTNLSCRELLLHEVSFGETSSVKSSELLINGKYQDDFHYTVEVDKIAPLGNGPWLPAEFSTQDTGKIFQIRVTDPSTGNKCWANVRVMELDMVFVKGGKFLMGSPGSEVDRSVDGQQHKVELSDFYIGKYEVTQKQWRDVMGSDPPELAFKNCDNCPVEGVSWDDIQEFIEKLNQLTGTTYRLPTEAEWEYAARGGGKSVLFGNGKNIADPKELNFDGSPSYKKSYSVGGEFRQKTVPVGSLNSPNALGLHEMSGNVWEWCSDWYSADYYKSSPDKNPIGPSSGSDRIIRGGSWGNDPTPCRVSYRFKFVPNGLSGDLGFRLARTN